MEDQTFSALDTDELEGNDSTMLEADDDTGNADDAMEGYDPEEGSDVDDQVFGLDMSAMENIGYEDELAGGQQPTDLVPGAENFDTTTLGQTEQALDNQLTMEMRELLSTDIKKQAQGNPPVPLAVVLYKLLTLWVDEVRSLGLEKSPHDVPLSVINSGTRIYIDDMLSMHYMEGHPLAAWFRDPIIRVLCDIESDSCADHTLVDPDLGLFLDPAYTGESLARDLVAVDKGEAPQLGWPLQDLTDSHSQVLACVNPSQSHWVTVEVILEKSPPRIRYYNSLEQAGSGGVTHTAVSVHLRNVLYIASKRPGSPIKPFDPATVVTEIMQCPRQAEVDIDCGPFAVFFLSHCIHNEPMNKYGLPTSDEDRHHLGQFIRQRCATVVTNYSDNFPLGSLYEGMKSYQRPNVGAMGRPVTRSTKGNAKRTSTTPAPPKPPLKSKTGPVQKPKTGPVKTRPKTRSVHRAEAARKCAEVRDEMADLNDLDHIAIQQPPDSPLFEPETGPGQSAEASRKSRVVVPRLPTTALTVPSRTSGAAAEEIDIDELDPEAGNDIASVICESINLDDNSDYDQLLVIVIRWSSVPQWLTLLSKLKKLTEDSFRHEVLKIAKKWLEVYLRSTNRPRSDLHVIVVTGTGVRTRYMPFLASAGSHLPMNLTEADDVGANTSHGNSLSFRCSLCDYNWESKERVQSAFTPSKLQAPLGHIGSHAMDWMGTGKMTKDSDGKWSATCTGDDCDGVPGQSLKRKADAIAKLHRHGTAKHASDWINSLPSDPGFEISCRCGAPNCETTYSILDSTSLQDHLSDNILVCPYCDTPTPRIADHAAIGKSSKLAVHWDQWNQPVPSGWHQCTKDVFSSDIEKKPWAMLKTVLQRRLAMTTSLNCAWNAAESNSCDHTQPFDDEAALKDHYDDEHAYHHWPLPAGQEKKCLSIFGSLHSLELHTRRWHLPDNFEEPGGKFEKNKMKRAYRLTQAITNALLLNSSRAQFTQDGVEFRDDPVLLSVGIDGFTCNTTLLAEWLAFEKDLDFTFIIGTDSILTLDAEHFEKDDDGHYTGTYTTHGLRRALVC
jgi:hypothetical protein